MLVQEMLWANCLASDHILEAILNNTQNDMEMMLFDDTRHLIQDSKPLLNRKVFRGTRVTIREHPYIVSIRRHVSHYCVGTLLTKNIVITVAHPLKHVSVTELSVVAGENYADRGTTLLTVLLIVMHEDFDVYTLANDIALVRIYEDLNFRGSIKPIQLVSPNNSIHGSRAFVTGWGRCDRTGRELCLPRGSRYYPNELLDPMLRTVSFYVRMPSHYCLQYKRIGIRILAGMLCTGPAREEDTTCPCMAVPGAPLVVGGCLAGLQSWGFGCGYSFDLPLVYTSMQHYQPWLLHNIPILRNITKEGLEPLFEATKASFLLDWLKETRIRLLKEHLDTKEHIFINIFDLELAKLWGRIYDVRDFVYEKMYHKCKNLTHLRKLLTSYENIRRRIDKAKKLSQIPSKNPVELAPFLDLDRITDRNEGSGLIRINNIDGSAVLNNFFGIDDPKSLDDADSVATEDFSANET